MKRFLLLCTLASCWIAQAEPASSNAPSIHRQIGILEKSEESDIARQVQLAKQLESGKADFVTYAGNDYTPAQALQLLPVVMKNSEEAERARYFNAVARFGPKLKGELLTPILEAFQKESSVAVKKMMFEAIRYSQDPRVNAFCVSAIRDTSPIIRLRAGFYFLGVGDPKGFRPITEALPLVSEGEKESALKGLADAVNRFKLDFSPSPFPVDRKLKNREKTEFVIREWMNWWAAHHAKVEQIDK